jgi:hypothetical protein
MKKDRHLKFIGILSKIAEEVPPIHSARLASAIVFKNDIISIGVNSRKTHPFQAKYGSNEESICLHSEVAAIRGALRYMDADEMRKCTLYVSRRKKRLLKNGHYEFVDGMAKPCVGCQSCIAQFGIKKVYYTTEVTNQYECL